ncbi:hypothetical protein HGRIS_000325 [Hohenbuehelia grisea]|uniref:Uncharacterized protein n=1 Tax=Hohenbuehelia grisea TaxID=104357 RepID=A0ABR3JQQ0_9AGAR
MEINHCVLRHLFRKLFPGPTCSDSRISVDPQVAGHLINRDVSSTGWTPFHSAPEASGDFVRIRVMYHHQTVIHSNPVIGLRRGPSHDGERPLYFDVLVLSCLPSFQHL